MKNVENFDKLMKAMGDLNKAHHELLMAIDDYEIATGTSVNDLQGFTESYPFDKSLDELAIHSWVHDVYNANRKFEFTVIDYEYLNTGGNTMVGIHEVWLPEECKTVYCYTNEEGCTISPVDYIRNEFDVDPSILTENYDWGRVTGYERRFELLRRCFNDYTKDDCKYFGITRRVPAYLLSDELQSKIHVDYLVWSEAESDGLVSTNGVDIVEDPDFSARFEDAIDKELQDLKDFKEWHDNLINNRTTDKELDELYESEYILTINGKSIKLRFDAENFNNINHVLKRAIEEF